MKIRILGCHGGETPDHRSTCFLIDDRITIDAGSICRGLSLEAQVQIDHMLISHSHMDHVKDLALLADQVIGQRDDPVRLYCGPETAETLRSSYFNNYLWPDFTKIPTPKNPTMDILEQAPMESFRLHINGAARLAAARDGDVDGGPLVEGEYEVLYIPVSHPVESMAMRIRSRDGAIIYSSDTGPTHQLWEVANKTEDLLAVFLELSFPNHMQALADVAGHYTPNTLLKDLEKFDRRDEVPIFVYHLKPTFYDATRDEFLALNLKSAQLVELTDEFELGR
jgi:ribonuclease BN (tRNA processing enzyme)